MKLHLELADLGVKGEGVKEHGADEGDVCGLAKHYILVSSYPDTL